MDKYWERRTAQFMWDSMEEAEVTYKDIAKLYARANTFLKGRMNGVFSRYATRTGLTQKEAERLIQALGASDLDKLIKSLPEDVRANIGANTAAYGARIHRYEELQRQVDDVMQKIFRQEKEISTRHYTKLAKDSYSFGVSSVFEQAGQNISFAHVDPDKLKQVLKSKWSGSNFSSRIWSNTSRLADTVKEEMALGILTGKSEKAMVDRLVQRFGVGANQARRLIRTESCYVSNQMVLEGYKDCGIEEYEFSACLDARTSEVCRELNGKKFKVEEAKVGINMPPMHPWCRSTTLAVFDINPEDLEDLDLDVEMEDLDLDVDLEEASEEEWRGRDESSFEPAGTIEEAQQYAEKFCQERFTDKTFRGKADFKGISLDHANEINRTLEKLYNAYDIPKISGIKTIDPNSAKGKKLFSSADAIMAYSPTENGIYVNRAILKNKSTLDAYNRQAAEAWNTVISNIDKLSGSQREIAERYMTAGRDLVGNGTVEDYLTHEMGHHVQWEVFDAKTSNEIGARMKQYSGKISGYATSSRSEYFAESFLAYIKGERDLLDPDFVSVLDKKAVDKKSGSGIIEMYRKGGTHRRLSETGTKIIDKATFHKITNPAVKRGADILIADGEILERLKQANATAVTYGDIIIFRKDATVSDVLEEVHHFYQNKSGLNSKYRDRQRVILNEIDAKEYVLSMTDKYNIPTEEVELTKSQLQSYKSEMEMLKKEGEWYDEN